MSPDFLSLAICDFSHAIQGKWPFSGNSLQNGHLGPQASWMNKVFFLNLYTTCLKKRMRLFAYNWKLPAYSGAFYLQLTILAFLLTIGVFLLTALASLLTIGVFFAYSGKVHLKRASRDCKQRSLTVSKKTPTVSRKASPLKNLVAPCS